jgi:hypothetical protein
MASNININERSYGGKKFRPKTQIFFDKSSQLLICVTPWGPSSIAEKVCEYIKNYMIMADEDSELTMVYAKKETLHQKGNTLRMAVIMASEKIYASFNKDEYIAGFEIFAAIPDGALWTYVSCGQPSLVLYRENLGIIPITHSVDLNILIPKQSILDPLPNNLLGLGQHPPIDYGSLSLQKNDRLALVSRTYLPNEFYKIRDAEFNQEQISNVLAQDNQELPFWLGFIDLN